ncbi:MAG: ferrous iron transport protein B [Candidatus Omnitrophica bacterium]|nr:ferrous iron transport protein B [Candidatus Omnitrophota bacterium]MDD5042453.1 ferrous iron transport protein B [Candidatus Omnitrophota bacterium]MDD5501156.1 ferrous iron transport protein B [Candidatus Omnitrophota bacterium]
MGLKGRLMVALAGNPNSGKSTIFNNLTGARQHVGNYPGVTVEKKEGRVVYRDYEITLVDLPGTYSLSANSEDEMVARDFIVNEKPDIVVHIADASNLERNLYLYTQLKELETPVVLAMNMSDIVERRGSHIDYGKISGLLGSPVIPTVGNKNRGMKELLDCIVDFYEGKLEGGKTAIDYGEEIGLELSKLNGLLGRSSGIPAEYPLKWLAVKMLENDAWVNKIVAQIPGGPAILLEAEKSRVHLKKHFSDDPEVIIADRRYGFISGVCAGAQSRTAEERHELSDKIDKIVLNRFLGLPIFAAVMYAIFKFTFTFSEPAVAWLENLIGKLGEFASAAIPEGLTRSFVADGIIGGVGGVLGFFPLVLFMFFAIAFFEDSGYMARAAFVMDRIMHKFGLHGKSFLPLMISTNGCAVPGIMASRTLDNKRDRLITMMVTPFMICGAKLPIFALFIGAFFPSEEGANMMFLMYGLSVVIALISAWALKKFVFKGESSHFVMELPPYRVPTIQGLLLKMWERGWLYLKKAGTIILLISIIIWAGFTFPEIQPGDGMSEEAAASAQMEQSFAGRAGKFVEPAVRPLGMDWRDGVALMAGVAAKEVVVSTLGTIYSLGEVDPEEAEPLKAALQNDPSWNPLKALAFLVFCLIYLPCFVAMAVFYRESGPSLKWTLFLIFWTTVLAWSGAFIVYQGGRLLGFGG